MTNRPSGIMELPDGSSVRASAILAIIQGPSVYSVTVVLGAGTGVELGLQDDQPTSHFIADLTAQWRAALGERTEPEQPAGNADDLWKRVPEGTDIDDMFGPDTEPERPAVAEFKEGDRVILRGALPDEPLGTVRAVSGVDRLAWVTWDGALMVLRATGHMFGDLEQS